MTTARFTLLVRSELLTAVSLAAVLAPAVFRAAVLQAAVPPEAPRYGAELEGFEYPHPVQSFRFESQQQALHMAYLDLAPSAKANGRVVVLLHGKNFCAASWVATTEALRGAG